MIWFIGRKQSDNEQRIREKEANGTQRNEGTASLYMCVCVRNERQKATDERGEKGPKSAVHAKSTENEAHKNFMSLEAKYFEFGHKIWLTITAANIFIPFDWFWISNVDSYALVVYALD